MGVLFLSAAAFARIRTHAPVSDVGRKCGSIHTAEAASNGVNCECWARRAAGSQRKLPAGAPHRGVVETGSHKKRGIRFADAIWNGKSCPFQKGGLFPSPFLPEIERWGVSRSADRDEGAALDLRTFEKVRSKL